MMPEIAMNPQLREVALRKEGQTYIFRFDAQSHRALLGTLARWATDAHYNFSWHDAAVVCKTVRDPAAKLERNVPVSPVNRLK